MPSQSLQLICDGEVEIIKITEDLYEEAIELFRNYFMKYENVSIACNLSEKPETIAEMRVLLKAILKDSISFAARDVKTQELVALCINKFVNPSAQITLDEIFASFSTPNMQTVGEYLRILEGTYDIFKEWQIDCVIELSFLSTRTDYAKRGIAVSLAKYLLQYAAKLKENDCEEAQHLPPHLRGQKPKAIISVFTSRYSQAVGEKLGFETLFKEENAKFTFEGKTFAEKIDPIHKYSTFAAKRL
ncbi:uncharacterized protein LOC119611645 [Lucilia sericata]|uniref:uncharacterized protein LOC119611645 n=1 Tax=Lucilia sericata TaxID=13632 RepID=UPI0018A7FB50|nr:uncharacterized protein LOC119611645 [Lucilia sericata]